MTDFPQSREPQNKAVKRNAVDDVQRKKNLAWQEVRNMNRPAKPELKKETTEEQKSGDNVE